MANKHTGRVIGSLTILSGYTRYTDGGNPVQMFDVRCTCGVEYVTGASLLSANNPKCKACVRKENAAASADGYKHPLYQMWRAMLDRCYSPSHPAYFRYGGRGIKVCDQWRGVRAKGEIATVDGFRAFCDCVGPKPSSKYSLDRYPDNDGDYEPGNVRWATQKQQCNNTRSNVRVAYRGETRTVTQWANLFGVSTAWHAAAKRHNILLEDALRRIEAAGGVFDGRWAAVFGAMKKPRAPRNKTVLTAEELEKVLASTESEWDKILADLKTLM